MPTTEVVASIALLSMLMIATLSLHRLHLRQIRLADKKLHAAELADTLIASWMVSAEPLPQRQSGQFVGNQDFNWRTRPIEIRGSNRSWNTDGIRVQVFEVDSSAPLIEIELVNDRELVPEIQAAR